MGSSIRFRDREDGGRQLATLLERFRGDRPIVLGLPRGGVPVAFEVARALDAPLDVIVARKIGAPLCPEYAVGAIAEGGAVFVDRGAAREAGVGEEELAAIAEQEAAELARRVRRFRGDRPLPELRGRTVILVDDGVATGRTARAAIRSLRQLGPARLVLAAPVVAADTEAELRAEVDELVYVQAPEAFMAVGLWYRSFEQTTDEEVVALLTRARAAGGAAQGPGGGGGRASEREVIIPAGRARLPGDLAVPAGAHGLVLFAHGSGSTRRSPRNRHVARILRGRGFATLLLDLLTEGEAAEDEITGALRFDVAFLAVRLAAATRFAREDEEVGRLPLGYFGASTGAAAALIAAADLPGTVAAVVSRGGRPDLAEPEVLARVRAPTLLVVGGDDREVLAMNREALRHLRVESRLEVVPGATHLFEEPGTLDAVADLAASWFGRHLVLPEGRAARPREAH